jgi:hypothetical protein
MEKGIGTRSDRRTRSVAGPAVLQCRKKGALTWQTHDSVRTNH